MSIPPTLSFGQLIQGGVFQNYFQAKAVPGVLKSGMHFAHAVEQVSQAGLGFLDFPLWICQTQRTFSGLICGHDSFCTVVSGPVAETLLETFQAHAAALNQEAFFPFCTLCKPVYFALDS